MKRKILSTTLLLVFLVGVGVACYHILSIWCEYRMGEKTYESMQVYVALPSDVRDDAKESMPVADVGYDPSESTPIAEETLPGETGSLEPVTETVLYPEVDFESLMEVSPDVVGWIYIDDTKINYPIVQGEDNRYYVSALIDGRVNGAGSIFMDYHNTPDFSDRHTILYGHNMKNGTMFAGITNYRSQEYYEAHPMGLIMTPERNYRFEIVSAYIASLGDPAWQLEFVDDADAMSWLENTMERSPFISRYDPQPDDRMITLSTCTYEFNDARFVLVGVLIGE